MDDFSSQAYRTFPWQWHAEKMKMKSEKPDHRKRKQKAMKRKRLSCLPPWLIFINAMAVKKEISKQTAGKLFKSRNYLYVMNSWGRKEALNDAHLMHTKSLSSSGKTFSDMKILWGHFNSQACLLWVPFNRRLSFSVTKRYKMKHLPFLPFFRLVIQAYSFINNRIWRTLSDKNEKLRRRKENSPVEAYEKRAMSVLFLSSLLSHFSYEHCWTFPLLLKIMWLMSIRDFIRECQRWLKVSFASFSKTSGDI